MEIIPESKNVPSVPGLGAEGTAGIVFCPYGFNRSPCLKQACELWVELFYGKQKVGRCSVAWNAILMPEVRQEMEKLRTCLQLPESNKKEGADAAA